jgi:hypothetical protein
MVLANVIAGFPGVGKTYFVRCLREQDGDCAAVDLDFRAYQQDWPQSYFCAILAAMTKYRFVFVSTHVEVRQFLREKVQGELGLVWWLVYPRRDEREAYISKLLEAAEASGAGYDGVSFVADHWDQMLTELEREPSVDLSTGAPDGAAAVASVSSGSGACFSLVLGQGESLCSGQFVLRFTLHALAFARSGMSFVRTALGE